MVTLCVSVPCSNVLSIPPNHAHQVPVRAPVPAPARQLGGSHSGVPKFVENSVHEGFGVPASKLPSETIWADAAPAMLTTAAAAHRPPIRVAVPIFCLLLLTPALWVS